MTEISNTLSIGGTPRATKRPDGTSPPAHWAASTPAPAPEDVPFVGQEVRGQPDPVRYGDWEIKGIAIDF